MIATLKRKENSLFIFLAGIFITNALLAELIGVKIFSLEGTLGMAPAQIKLLDGFVLDFNLTAGVLLWPIVFITTDIINEYFGQKGVRRISFLTVGFIGYSFLIIIIVTNLVPAEFWLNINQTDSEGNPFNVDYAYHVIFRQGAWIIVGSLVAFLVGQLLDVIVFHKLRRITGSGKIWLRATGSTLVSQLIDSFVVLGIAFYLGADWTLAQWFSVGIINYLYKFAIAILLTPVLYIAHYLIDRYLGKSLALELTEAAAQKRS